MRFDGVHAFGYNSTGSEPIWMKSGTSTIHSILPDVQIACRTTSLHVLFCLPLGLEPSLRGWRRGVVASVVRRMNEVTLRRARLVLGWVTVFGRVHHHGM